MIQARATVQSMGMQARAARAGAWNRRYASWLAIAIIVAGALDAFSTDLALATGLAVEANPLIAALQSWLGEYWVMPKMIIHGLLAAGVAWFPNRLTLGVMTGVAAMVLMVATNNFIIFHAAINSV